MKTEKSTITDLPGDIRKALPEWEQNAMVKEIIKQAEAGEFHDYKNNLYTCGKQQLVEMLYKSGEPGLVVIMNGVINGEYDESPDAEDKALMKKDWLDNGGSLASYESMFGKD